MRILNTFTFIFFILCADTVFADFEKLTKSSYEKSGSNNAVVIYGANWGRQWGCSKFDNAQLLSLSFSRINSVSRALDEQELLLNSGLKLSAKNISQPYAIIVSPGEYALTGFDIKVSNSSKEVGHIRGTHENLFENEKPVGGTFTVNAGEIVYIGDFGLDCLNEPIFWRFYIQKEDFKRYVDQFKKEYKFLADRSVIYRLFQTEKFGQ